MEIIDVTLRESVYCDDSISMEAGFEIIKRLSSSGIDYIEIGYLKKDYATKSFFMNYNPEYIEKAYSIAGKKSKLSAMIHPQDFSSNHWDPDVIKKLSLVRICVNGTNITEIKPLIDFFHKIRVRVSLNLTHISRYDERQCSKIARLAVKNGADLFYIADSNGNLLPEEIRKNIKVAKAAIGDKAKLGFHPHNNLGLSQINALTAIQNNADIVDSSILGFGKGAGNLRTELFPLLLLRKNIINKTKYNIKRLFETAKYFNDNIVKTNNFEEQYKYSLFGLKNVGLKEDEQIKKIALENNVKDYDLAFNYAIECGCDFKKLEKIVKHNKNKVINDK